MQGSEKTKKDDGDEAKKDDDDEAKKGDGDDSWGSWTAGGVTCPPTDGPNPLGGNGPPDSSGGSGGSSASTACVIAVG